MNTIHKPRNLRTASIAMGLVAMTVLGGCLSTDQVIQETSRVAAKRAVNQVISVRFPGVNAAPYTDCVIDNATTEEIVSLAKDAATGNQNNATSTVLEIAGRRPASTCITQSAVLSVLG